MKLFFLPMVWMLSDATAVVDALSSPSTPTKTIVITHAAGRMGKLLALQLHERDSDCKVRAICTSGKERDSIRFDLGGIKLVAGKMVPAVSHDNWLDIVVVDDAAALPEALEGTTTAVLCSAAHNQVVQEGMDGSISVRPPPPSQDKDSNIHYRLVAEVQAALDTPGMEHIVVRSSMGLGPDTPSHLADAMGGLAAILSGPQRAEALLLSHSDDNPGISTTVLRLGALTDDAGPLPLEFAAADDAMLISRAQGLQADDSNDIRSIPLISRSDAARVLCHTALVGSSPSKGISRTADVAWNVKYGAHSLGLEEVQSQAMYQDLEACLMKAAGTDRKSVV